MKKKNSSKKLILSKETIANLSDIEKNMIKGGTGYPTERVCGISKTMYNDTGCGINCQEQ